MPEAPAERYDPYVPRVVLRLLAQDPEREVEELEGTVVFVDLSGFTKLSERLARLGREGAECLAGVIDDTFAQLLAEAYGAGGSLLKFGGDALLLLFDGPGHVARACRAAAEMRRVLRAVGRIERRGARIRLRMSVGVHTDAFPVFLVGRVHRELLTVGPGWTTVVEMESAADAGEVLLSPATAARLPPASVGPVKGPGRLLAAAPAFAPAPPEEPTWRPAPELVAACLPRAVAGHLEAGHQPPEHRNATIAFVHFDGTDALVAEAGAPAVAPLLRDLVDDVARAAEQHRVAFLATDVDADGGKFLLCAGAPTVTGDDEERMLLTVRAIVDADRPLPVRAGVNRGPVFASAVGPPYRRTYTVMGDAVNLAARLMGRAGPDEVYVTQTALERSATAFATRPLAPFTVKGKARPVHAWELGAVVGRQTRPAGREVSERFPLFGREVEQEVLTRTVADARAGEGRLVEIASEPGLGKTRLLEELVDAAPELRPLTAVCEAYTASMPYRAWRDPLRQALGITTGAPADRAGAELAVAVAATAPELTPWLPLIALPFGAEAPETPEVRRLAPEFRVGRLHEAVIRLLRTVMGHPTLLAFEDVHLMDRASADLLTALVPELPGLPWLVAVTRRDDDAGFVAPEADAVVRLEPAPLSAQDTLALAEAVTEAAPLPPSLLMRVAERSGGSPQFLRDLLRAAADGAVDLPESIEAAAMARIDRLRPADRALVRRAAVLGVAFDERLLAQVLDDGEAPDAATWRRLSRYFADDGDGRHRFRRAVVRDVAYAGLPFATRRRLHAQVGAHLERELGPAADEQAASLSLHFLHAGEHVATWRYARIAAERAARASAYADAAVLYRRALEAARTLPVAPTLLSATWEALGEACSHTGEPEAAQAAFTAARRLLHDDPVREARLLHRHALVELDAGRVRQAVRWLKRGLRLVDGLDGRGAQACRAHLVGTLATVRHRGGRHKEAATLARHAMLEAEAARDDPALARACYTLDTASAYAGEAVDGRHFRRALEIFTRLEDLDRQAAVLNNMGIAAYWAGRWSEAVDLYRRAADASLAAGDAANAAYGDCNVGEVLSDQGRVDEAEPLLRRALRVWRGTAYDWGVAYVTTLLGRAATRAGRLEEALALLEDAVSRFTALGTTGEAAWADALRAEAAACAGDPDDALERVDRLLLDHAGTGRLSPLLHRIRGCALAQQGHFAAAEGALGASLAEARLQQEDYEVAVTQHALLGLDVLRGRRPDRRRVRERDRILIRLGVVGLQAPALAPGQGRLAGSSISLGGV